LNLLENIQGYFFDILEFSLASAVGQIFIFYTIHEFGALMCSIITTIRKFCSILFSIFWYAHPLSLTGIISITVVFVGLALDRINEHYEEEQNKDKSE